MEVDGTNYMLYMKILWNILLKIIIIMIIIYLVRAFGLSTNFRITFSYISLIPCPILMSSS